NTPSLSGAKFSIYWNGVKDAITPDVGWNIVNNEYMVVFTYVYSPTAPIDLDIYAQPIKTTGATDGPTIGIATSTQIEEMPTVVPVSGNTQQGIAWIYRALSGAQGDVSACCIDMGNKQASTTVQVSTAADDENNPELSSTTPSTGYLTWSRQP